MSQALIVLHSKISTIASDMICTRIKEKLEYFLVTINVDKMLSYIASM